MYVFIIKQVREEKGISQQELANKINISRSYLSKIENNKINNVSFNVISNIADVLEVEITDLYVPDRNVEVLREMLHISIEKYGLNDEKTIEISHLIDLLINEIMEK